MPPLSRAASDSSDVGQRSFAKTYGVVIAAVGLAGLTRWLLDPLLGGRAPFFTFVFAVVFATWYGGFRPAIFAAFLGLATAQILFSASRLAVLADHGPWVNAAIYLAVCVVIASFGQVMRTAQNRARQSERLYRTLFESMDEGYCIIEMIFDPDDRNRAVDYRFLEVNPAFESQAGMRDVTGKRMLEFVPSIEEHWLKNYGRVARTGESIRFANEYKTLHRWFDVYAFRIGTADDPKVAVLFTDITERKRFELALQESDRRKDEFIATLAHELRNPLAPLRNGLQIMKLVGDDPEILEEARVMMDRQLDQMVHLVDDLLDVSRISRGKIQLKKECVLLSTTIRSAVESTRPFVDAAGHSLTVSIPPEPIYVDGDPVRLAQIFSNLLNNAAKYTASTGRIELVVERQGGEVVVCVRDNGIGIPSHMLSKVFDMFTQVDQSNERAQGGLGIGLSIVKQLVLMHGGGVEARSEGVGTGSELVVRLPVAEAASRPMIPPAQDVPPIQRANRRVLIVDDNRDAAKSLGALLGLVGAEIRTAHDGHEAISVASKFRPDLILLDIGMPNLNGYDTARRIRSEEWGSKIQIVALTGWGQQEDKRKAIAAGFNAHLVKPASADALQSLLRQLSP